LLITPGVETKEPRGSRVIQLIIRSDEFINNPLIGFITIIVQDKDTGCTLAPAGTRDLGIWAVFALIPGLVLLRLFTRRLRRKR